MHTSIEFLIRAGQKETGDALRDYAERRLSFALRRFAHRIRRVMFRLVDENGPRRGVDTRCSIAADMIDGRRLFVEASAAWPFTAITRAAHRLNESIRRELGRDVGRGRQSAGTASLRHSRELRRAS
jgi:putative sigma-54 modulation protein